MSRVCDVTQNELIKAARALLAYVYTITSQAKPLVLTLLFTKYFYQYNKMISVHSGNEEKLSSSPPDKVSGKNPLNSKSKVSYSYYIFVLFFNYKS